MNIIIIRTYHTNGTNGILYIEGKEVCKTIELAWKDNAVRKSCIPEGSYRLAKRHSVRHGWHFEIVHVCQRQCILIHPANNAAVELMGCIAPVSRHSGDGVGTYSRKAMEELKRIVYPALDSGEIVNLQILS